MTQTLDRRTILAAGAALAATPALAQTPAPPLTVAPILTKPIPHGGEQLPVVGSGSAQIYAFTNDPAAFAERRETLKILGAGQVRVIDTAPGYGAAEDRLGELFADLGMRNRFFLATKVSANRVDRAAFTTEMEASKRRLKTDKFELMQYWNVSNATQDFGLLKEWKAQGICKYHGMSSTSDGAYTAFEQVLAREKPDFIQVDYAIDNRNVEERILPAARDNDAAVLTALPFGRNRLFQRVGSTPLPDFAKEIDATTWAQFFLKFLISHRAVNCVIPGTDKPQYALDNLAAGRGRMPDAAMRARMAAFVAALPG